MSELRFSEEGIGESPLGAWPSVAELLKQGLTAPGSPVFELAQEAVKTAANTQTREEFVGTIGTLSAFMEGEI